MVSVERSSGTVLVDVLALTVVPVVLVGIHFLVPPGLEERIVLRPGHVTPLTLYSAAFFHLGIDHLLGNLVAYAIGAGYAYFLGLAAGERRWFWGATAALLLGLPILVNWSSIQIMNAVLGGWVAPMRGFSGVSAGFGGLAFVALVVYVRDRVDPRSAGFVALGVLLVLLWEVLVIYADGIPPVGTAAVLVGVGLALVGVVREWDRRGRPASRDAWRTAGFTTLVVAWMVVVLSVLVAGMYPADIVVGGRFTNIFAHTTGFVIGALIAGWGYRYWRRRPSLADRWRAAAEG